MATGETRVQELIKELIELKSASSESPIIPQKRQQILEAIRNADKVVFSSPVADTLPLVSVAGAGEPELVEAMLQRGAPINEPNLKYPKSNPLLRAAVVNSLVCIEVLLRSKAEVNVVDAQKNTPLHKVADWGNAEAVHLLLICRAIPILQNNDGLTPLMLANQSSKTLSHNYEDGSAIAYLQAAEVEPENFAQAVVPALTHLPNELVDLIGSYYVTFWRETKKKSPAVKESEHMEEFDLSPVKPG